MMSGHGANAILFDKKNKDWMSKTLATPHALCLIASHFCHPPTPYPIKVDLICVSPLSRS